MNRFFKITLCYVICFVFFLMLPMEVLALPQIEAPSYILMEASTGQIICEKDAFLFSLWLR